MIKFDDKKTFELLDKKVKDLILQYEDNGFYKDRLEYILSWLYESAEEEFYHFDNLNDFLEWYRYAYEETMPGYLKEALRKKKSLDDLREIIYYVPGVLYSPVSEDVFFVEGLV